MNRSNLNGQNQVESELQKADKFTLQCMLLKYASQGCDAKMDR